MIPDSKYSSLNIHFLHGFLGFASDWDIFKKNLELHACEAYEIESFLPNPDAEKNYFKEWAKNFNDSICYSNSKNVLVGYSLGGRLALHSLQEQNQWDAVVIISANPGLSSEEDRIARIKNDENWAMRFLKDPWDSVMNAWNSQGVFSGQKNQLIRNENLYNREKIYEILVGFSLGKQENLREMIGKVSIPMLWISGELDSKFATIGQEMASLNRNLKHVLFPNVGHRVPWENPEKFENTLTDFLLTI